MLSCSFLEVFIRRLVWTFSPLSDDVFSLFSHSVSIITILSSAALWIVLSHYLAATLISLTTLPLLWQDTHLASWSEWENQCIKIHLLSTATVYIKMFTVYFSLIPFGFEKAVFDQLFQVDSSQPKATKQHMPCVFSGKSMVDLQMWKDGSL